MSTYELLKEKINNVIGKEIGLGSTFTVQISDGNYDVGEKLYIDFINDRELPITYRLTDGWNENWYQLETINERFINKGQEPMLNDVIKYLIITQDPSMHFDEDVINMIALWDLSNSLLKAQSQELLAYVSSFQICN